MWLFDTHSHERTLRQNSSDLILFGMISQGNIQKNKSLNSDTDTICGRACPCVSVALCTCVSVHLTSYQYQKNRGSDQ